jgi:hypothetical protein
MWRFVRDRLVHDLRSKGLSAGEEAFALHLKAHKIPFEREYLFAKPIGRQWRADFFIEPDILVEIEGGVFVQGRHNRGAAMVEDMTKYNSAILLGYRLLRFEPSKHVDTGIAIETVLKALSEPAVRIT